MELDVEFVRVTKSFGNFVAVDAVTFSVPKGSFFSLLGPSGCGKSTTLRMISGFEQPDRGDVRIAGRDMVGVPAYRRPTNMVFQRWALFPHMTASENVAFGLEVERRPRPEVKQRVAEALALVGLSEFSGRKPGQLSGGQMQRVALARALVKRPKVLLLDEPLGALDLKLRTQMQLELKRIQKEVGTTFVYVTHDQGEAMTMSDAIAVMNNGCIEQLGTPQKIYDEPATRFVASFIGNANIFPVTVARAGTALTARAGDLSISIAGGPSPPREGPAHMALRYERVKLGAAAAALPNCYSARVWDVIFSGSAVQYVLRLEGSAVELIAEAPYDGTGSLLSVGALVEVGWDPTSPRVFADA